mgnify:CR=1 FL=1
MADEYVEEEEGERGYPARRSDRAERGGRGGRDFGGEGGGRRFGRRSRISPLYADPNFRIDYKDPETLRRFVTDHGKIRPRRQTGLFATVPRRLAREVKRARHLALLPFASAHTRE